MIKSLVWFTYPPENDIVREFKIPGVRVNSAAVEELDESLPIVPMKGDVVIAAPGFVILPSVIIMSETREVEAKALLTVNVRLVTLQDIPEILEPPILTSMHVALDMSELVYYAGKVIVAVSDADRGVVCQGV